MGDPLSAAASVLTLLSASGAVGKFLKKVVALKRAPDILLALNNDIADLHHLVQTVHELLQEHSRITDKVPLGYVSESLEKVKKTLSTFEQLVSYRLTVVEGDGSHLRLDRSEWLRVEDGISRLRKQSRGDKGDLCLALTLLTNSTSLQGVIRSHTLQLSATDLEDQIARTSSTVFSQLELTEQSLRAASEERRQQGIALDQIGKSLDQDRVDRRTLSHQVQAVEVLLRGLSNRQQVQAQSLQDVERKLIRYHEIDEEQSRQPQVVEAGLNQSIVHYHRRSQSLTGLEECQLPSNLDIISTILTLSRRESEESIRSSSTPHAPEHPATNLSSLRNISFSYSTPFKLTRNSCDSACRCVCHRRSQFKSPRSLNALLGSLFVGYQASPWSSQTCSNSDCRRRSKKFTYVYAFPGWFLARILVVDMAYSLSKGPEMCLRVMRVRSEGFNPFWDWKLPTRTSAAHHLERLLSDGEISVLDIDTQGYTLLHRAFRLGDLRAAELLIRCGADINYQNDWGRSAFVEACEIFLTDPKLGECETFLREKLWSLSQLESFEFSDLQKAYFGLSGITYRTALSKTPRPAINEVDRLGRTILSWASRKSDAETVAELLACGADPNIIDLCGGSSLHYAALGSSKNCSRLLLASKAELEVKDVNGMTPLAIAASRSSVNLKIFLEAGADIETQDFRGFRPMHNAIIIDHAQNVRHLLHAGADMFAEIPSGTTTLDFAIIHNCHSALRVLLEAQASSQLLDDLWSELSFLRVAWYADQETLEILHSAVSSIQLSLRIEDGTITQVVRIAKWRRDWNQKWSEETLGSCDKDPVAWFQSFELLLQAVTGRQLQIFGGDDDDDGGGGGDDEANSQLGENVEEETSDKETVDETEDEESWEDARES